MRCPNCQSENDNDAATCFTCGSALGSTIAIRRGSVLANRYEILEPLGKGGMGMVYKAHDRELEETVAVKVLRADVAADPDMQRRFRSEIRLARKVRHRNVCGIHEFGQDGNLRFIAMEYIEGVDLRHVLNRKGAPLPEEAFEISIQASQGLQAIHEAGVIHRDLKTPNIMRDAKGHVRLMDFGIAKEAGGTGATLGATALGMIVGTPEYMSPEQARGEKIDFRSDVYAMGIVIFEIFTGNVPFRGETPIATIFKHLQDPPPLYGEAAAALPDSLVPVLARCLAKQPAERYEHVAELVEALLDARLKAFPHARLSPTGTLRAGGGTSPTPLPGTTAMPTPVPGTTAMPTPAPTNVPFRPATVGGSATPMPKRTVVAPRPSAEAARATQAAVQTPAPSPKVDSARVGREAVVKELLARADGLASAQRLDEAQLVLYQAVQADPSNTLAMRLLSQITAELEHQEEARGQAEQEVARQRTEQQAAEAERARHAAEAARERQAAEAQREQQAEAARQRQAAEVERLRQGAAEAARQREQAEAARHKQEEESRRRASAEQARKDQEHREATRQAAQREAAQREAAQREAARREAAQREAAQRTSERQQTAAEVTPIPAPPRLGPPIALIAGGGVALVALAIAGWLLLGPKTDVAEVLPAPDVSPAPVVSPVVEPSAGPSAAPSVPADIVPAAPPGMGMLVIDAAPWGEVVEVVDAAGKKQPLGRGAYTPLTLSLPAGEYRVSVTNPAHPGPIPLTAKVDASGVARLRHVFQRVDPDAYFQSTGW